MALPECLRGRACRAAEGRCLLGHRVALIDADLGLRNLDLLLGLENRILYTAMDVLEGPCCLHQALICDKRWKNLSLLFISKNRRCLSVSEGVPAGRRRAVVCGAALPQPCQTLSGRCLRGRSCRAAEGRHDKELAQAVRMLLERAAASPQPPPSTKRAGGPSFGLGVGGGAGGSRGSPHGDAWDLRWSALAAGRAGLRGALFPPACACEADLAGRVPTRSAAYCASLEACRWQGWRSLLLFFVGVGSILGQDSCQQVANPVLCWSAGSCFASTKRLACGTFWPLELESSSTPLRIQECMKGCQARP